LNSNDTIELSNINKNWFGQLILSSCPTINHESEPSFPENTLIEYKRRRVKQVVTLLDSDEMEDLGIISFSTLLMDSGFHWIHCPIRDRSTFSDQKRIRTLLEDMKEVLKPNNSVLIHCHAGLGRTGLLAAIFLVSMGLTAESAIKTIRTTRPGSIETIEQERYIKEWDFCFN
tara:strand:+ start:631 stop:1149 length:519 start_codon:yes stop_codon:yes gene_type:complete